MKKRLEKMSRNLVGGRSLVEFDKLKEPIKENKLIAWDNYLFIIIY